MTQDTSLTDKQKFWLEHIDACSKSGQTMKAYAQSNDLSVSAIYAWKKTLRRKGVIAGPLSGEPPLFHKAVIADYRIGRARVLLLTGTVLEFDAGTDPHWIGALIRTLS